jgi:hypothetical protein
MNCPVFIAVAVTPHLCGPIADSAADSCYGHVLAWLDGHLIHLLYTARGRWLILQSFSLWIASLLTGLMTMDYKQLFA